MITSNGTTGKRIILVSACLLGLRTRYNGAACARDRVLALTDRCTLVPICPEQLGGLPTPRTPSEIESGDGRDVLEGRAPVISQCGMDVTDQFLRGADAAVRIAQLAHAREAILREGSPSCGVEQIRRGEMSVSGCGVTTAALLGKGVRVENAE